MILGLIFEIARITFLGFLFSISIAFLYISLKSNSDGKEFDDSDYVNRFLFLSVLPIINILTCFYYLFKILKEIVKKYKRSRHS